MRNHRSSIDTFADRLQMSTKSSLTPRRPRAAPNSGVAIVRVVDYVYSRRNEATVTELLFQPLGFSKKPFTVSSHKHFG